jgi:hypothetical protein
MSRAEQAEPPRRSAPAPWCPETRAGGAAPAPAGRARGVGVRGPGHQPAAASGSATESASRRIAASELDRIHVEGAGSAFGRRPRWWPGKGSRRDQKLWGQAEGPGPNGGDPGRPLAPGRDPTPSQQRSRDVTASAAGFPEDFPAARESLQTRRLERNSKTVSGLFAPTRVRIPPPPFSTLEVACSQGIRDAPRGRAPFQLETAVNRFVGRKTSPRLPHTRLTVSGMSRRWMLASRQSSIGDKRRDPGAPPCPPTRRSWG